MNVFLEDALKQFPNDVAKQVEHIMDQTKCRRKAAVKLIAKERYEQAIAKTTAKTS